MSLSEDLAAGQTLTGRYRILDKVGEGSYGTVYRAFDENLGEEVALKVLRQDKAYDDNVVRRFRNESSLARRVTHRNIVRIRDLAEETGLAYLVMDYVPGTTLSQRLRANGPLPPAGALAILRQIASALGEAHARGVIHRDLKPGNILLDGTGQAFVTDFGIARSLQTQLTRTGEVLGTPDYLSPEQARGESVDGRSDIYSLGILLIEMLSGRSPFAGGTVLEVMAQHMAGKIGDLKTLVPGLTPEVERILERCLAKSPEDRYATAEELVADIDGLPRPFRFPPLRRWLPWAAGLVVTAGLAVVAPILFRGVAGRAAPVAGTAAPGPAAYRHSVAVLPLAAEGLPESLAWASSGVAEMLASSLAESQELRVTESARVFELLRDLGLSAKLSDAELRQVADLLQVDRLALGKLRGSGETVRLEGELYDAAAARRRAIFAEEANGERLFDLVGGLAATLRRGLEVPPATSDRLPTASPAALSAYGEGRERLLRGDALAAVEPLRRAVAADPEFTEAWVRLARALHEIGREEEAAEAARGAASSIGEGAGGRLELEVRAEEAERRGEVEQAQKTLEELVRQYPNDLESRIALAESFGAQGNLAGARRELEAVVALDPNHGRAWYLLGRYSILAGDPRLAAEEQLVRALVVFRKQRNEGGQADVNNAMGVAHERLGRLDEARASFEEAASERRRLGDARGLAATLINLGMVDMTRGDFAASRARLDEARSLHEKLKNPAGAAEAFNSLGLLAEEEGDYPAALERYRQALQLRQELGDERALAESYGNVGYADYLVGRCDDSLLYSRRALDLYRKSGDRFGALQVAQNVGACEFQQGRFDEATKTFVETLRESRELESKNALAVSQGYLGRIAQAQGRYSASFAAYRAALAPLAELEDRRGQVEFTLFEAEALLDLGLVEDAEGRLATVGAWLAEGASHEHRARLALLRAAVLARRGARAEAKRELAAATKEAAASHGPALEIEAALAAAALAGDEGRTSAARSETAAALERARSLGAVLLRLRAGEQLARIELARDANPAAATAAREAIELAAKAGSYAASYRLHELLAAALAGQNRPEESTRELELGRAERARIVEGLDVAGRVALRPAPAFG